MTANVVTLLMQSIVRLECHKIDIRTVAFWTREFAIVQVHMVLHIFERIELARANDAFQFIIIEPKRNYLIFNIGVHSFIVDCLQMFYSLLQAFHRLLT